MSKDVYKVMSTFKEVDAWLNNLEINKDYNVGKLVRTILQITNFQQKTIEGFLITESHVEREYLEDLDDLWVDLTYQRVIRLRKIVNKIQKHQGFNHSGAGRVDVAIRTSGRKYVWDGLRRCIKAGICGLSNIAVTRTKHLPQLTELECRREEALWFKMRQADTEKMKPEEVWRAEVVFRDPDALKFLDLIKNANLNVEQQNPNGVSLGGFSEVFNSYIKNVLSEKVLVRASNIIQSVYSKETNVSGYLLVGLSWLLQKNENLDEGSYTDEDITSKFNDWVNTVDWRQNAITKNRLNAKTRESIAYIIAKRVLKDNNGLIQNLGMLDDDMDVVDNA